MDELLAVRRRLQAQGLTGEPFDAPEHAVAWSGAVQAQEVAEAQWSIGQRVRNAVEIDVEAACVRGDILRTHVLRPTWHFVAAADIRWLLRLTAPRVQARTRYRYRQLELDDDLRRHARTVLARASSSEGALTRAELAGALGRAGIRTDGQRLAHIAMDAELEGLICSGPRRGKQHTYVLLDQRAPPAPERSRDEDLAELVLRYFRSHGPATLKDFAWWSSLTIADARAGVALAGDRLVARADDDGRTWVAASDAATPARMSGVLLLPTYDEAVVAYRDLKLLLAGQPPDPGRLIRAILLDGRTVGSWKRILSRREVTVEATLFGSLGVAASDALRRAVERFGRFLGLPATLEVKDVIGEG